MKKGLNVKSQVVSYESEEEEKSYHITKEIESFSRSLAKAEKKKIEAEKEIKMYKDLLDSSLDKKNSL